MAVELAVLFVFLTVPPLPDLLGGSWPTPLGWLLAALAAPLVLGVDTLHKAVRSRSAARADPMA